MGQRPAGLHAGLEAEQSELVGRLLLLTLLINTPYHEPVSSLGGWITKEHQTTCPALQRARRGPRAISSPCSPPWLCTKLWMQFHSHLVSKAGTSSMVTESEIPALLQPSDRKTKHSSGRGGEVEMGMEVLQCPAEWL